MRRLRGSCLSPSPLCGRLATRCQKYYTVDFFFHMLIPLRPFRRHLFHFVVTLRPLRKKFYQIWLFVSCFERLPHEPSCSDLGAPRGQNGRLLRTQRPAAQNFSIQIISPSSFPSLAPPRLYHFLVWPGFHFPFNFSIQIASPSSFPSLAPPRLHFLV